VRTADRAALAVLVAIAAAGTLGGCSAGAVDGTESSTPPTASEYEPSVTEQGAALVSRINDCAGFAAQLGTLTAGLELTVESVDEAGIFCDWVSPEDPDRIISVEVLGTAAQAVPSTAEVTASGATIVENATVRDAGGIAYSLTAADETAYSLTAVVPEYSVSISALGAEIPEEQTQQILDGIEVLLTRPAE